MDRIIKLIQAAGAIALVVAITVGYGAVREASASEGGWCDEAEYCQWDTPGNYEHVACATSHCDTTMQWCCLDGISN